MMQYILTSLKITVVTTLLLGIAYPLLITGIAQLFFPYQANGSLIKQNGAIIGSELIAQKFESDKYFHPRPSAIDYNPVPSGGTNFSSTSKALSDSVALRKKIAPHLSNEMFYSSASGIDPHISPEAAQFQIERVSKARGLDSLKTEHLKMLVMKSSESPQWKIFGNSRVNVLKLNLTLDDELR